MDFGRIMLGLFVMLLFAGVSFAGCATDAFHKACASCTFDSYGKIDQSCSTGYKDSGAGCVSKTYPIMAGKYAMGQCQDLNVCASQLSSCAAQYSSGNDQADCQEGWVNVCYSQADECVKRASASCEEVQSPCGVPAFALLTVLAGALFVRRK